MIANLRLAVLALLAVVVAVLFMSQTDAGIGGSLGAWGFEAAGSPFVNGILPVAAIGFVGLFAWVVVGPGPMNPRHALAMAVIGALAVLGALTFTDGAAEANGHDGSNLSWMLSDFVDTATGNTGGGGGR